MPVSTTAIADDLGRTRGNAVHTTGRGSNTASAVSWGAVLAGAAAAASLSLILLILGVGLGLSSVSPWARDGVSATTFGLSTILWLTFTQLLASGLGGYLAGRLRTRWTELHSDEVYFRDTAHGFLAWAVASLVTAALLASVIGSIVSGGVQAGAAVVGGAASTATAAAGAAATAALSSRAEGAPTAYFVDSLFRREAAAPATAGTGNAGDVRGQDSGNDAIEIGRIFMNAGRNEPLPPEDLRYIGQIVAERTGLAPQDAEKRVADVFARAQARVQQAELAAREATDKARKASAYSALWLFVSLLIGAFVASLAATFGGRRRDA